jgi:uncharacterized protein (DUF779 family)
LGEQIQRFFNVHAGIGVLAIAAWSAIAGIFGQNIAHRAIDLLGYVPIQQLQDAQRELEAARKTTATSLAERMIGDPMVWTAKAVGLESTGAQCVADAVAILQEQEYQEVKHGDIEGQPFYVLGQFWENKAPAKVIVDCYGDRLGMLFPSVSIAVKFGDQSTGRERVNRIREALIARRRELSRDEVIVRTAP